MCRDIAIERSHWLASMSGFRTVPPYGIAFVHTDGSIALGQHGTELQCRCGGVHVF